MSKPANRPGGLPQLHLRVVQGDCGSAGHSIGVLLAENGDQLEPLRERVCGLAAAADVTGPDGRLLFSSGQRITTKLLGVIGYQWDDHVRSVPVRSPRSCTAAEGVCEVCYPGDLRAAIEAAGKGFRSVRSKQGRAVLARAFRGTRPAKASVLAKASGILRYGGVARGRVELLAGDTPLGRIRYEPESFWMPREGQRVDAGEVLEWGEEEWLADVLRLAGEAAFHERFLARTQYWFRKYGVRIQDADLELWSRQLALRLGRKH